jgi:hypothetical protein
MRESPGNTPLILGATTVETVVPVDATGVMVPTDEAELTTAVAEVAISEQV